MAATARTTQWLLLSLQVSLYLISFLTDDIIRFRYVEIDGQLRKVMVVLVW